MVRSSYFGNGSSEQSVRTNFPLTKTILWDKRPTGTETEISFSHFRDISLHLIERSLRLSYKNAVGPGNTGPVSRGFFLGSVSTEDEELCVTLNRFDCGRELSGSTGIRVPVSPLPGDVIVPLVMVRRGVEIDDCTHMADDLISDAVRHIEKVSSSLESVNVLNFFRIICLCQYSDQYGELCFEFSWTLIAPSVPLILRPVAPVSVIPTALARNLSGPLNLSSLQNAPKNGFLTMDQTRKLLLLLESDPKIIGLPLIGVWVSGVASPCDIHLWATLSRFLKCPELKEKQTDGQNGFLAMVYLTTERQPAFFDCYESDPGFSYNVFTAQEELNLFKEEDKKADSTFIFFSLAPTETSNAHAVIEVAMRTLQNAKLKNCENATSEVATGCNPVEELPLPCPQFVPSSHLPVSVRVPDVSVWEERDMTQHLNRSDSCEQDAGFYSKSSSDHDLSADRLPFPSRQRSSPPMETIESSTNMTSASSVAHSRHTSGDRTSRGNPTRLCTELEEDRSPRSVIAASECNSCRSDKAELVSNLAQQKRQLEMLQTQIQALLKSQNTNDVSPRVSTRSAQTSPANSTNNSLVNDQSHLRSIVGVSQNKSRQHQAYGGSQFSGSSAPQNETLVSINPDSVPLQEDMNSSENGMITHVDMPSFADSDFSGTQTSLQLGESVSVLMENSMDVDFQHVRCLNSSQLSTQSSTNHGKLQMLSQQIAAVLNHSDAGEQVHCGDSPKSSNVSRLSVKSATSSRTSNLARKTSRRESQVSDNVQKSHHSSVANNFTDSSMTVRFKEGAAISSEKTSSVNVSLEANAIAMRYNGSAENRDSSFIGLSSYQLDMDYQRYTAARPSSDFSSAKQTNISLATAKYLERHGMAGKHNTTPFHDISNDFTRLSNDESTDNILPPNFAARRNEASEKPGTYSKDADGSNWLPSQQPVVPYHQIQAQSVTDSQELILDISKLRSLPKLM